MAAKALGRTASGHPGGRDSVGTAVHRRSAYAPRHAPASRGWPACATGPRGGTSQPSERPDWRAGGIAAISGHWQMARGAVTAPVDRPAAVTGAWERDARNLGDGADRERAVAAAAANAPGEERREVGAPQIRCCRRRSGPPRRLLPAASPVTSPTRRTDPGAPRSRRHRRFGRCRAAPPHRPVQHGLPRPLRSS